MKSSDESLHQLSLPDWNQIILTLLQTYSTKFPDLRGAMPLSRWQRTVCSRSLLLITRACQNEGDVISHIFEVIPSPDASRPVADQEVDVGNAVKSTLMSFTTTRKLFLVLAMLGTKSEARRTCLYFSDCQEVALPCSSCSSELYEELKRARVYIRTKPDPQTSLVTILKKGKLRSQVWPQKSYHTWVWKPFQVKGTL